MLFSADLRRKPSRLELPDAPHGDIRFNGKGQDETLELAVLGDQPDAEILGMPGVANGRGLAAQKDLVSARLVSAVDGPDDLGAARANEADKAQDLALVKLERDVVELVSVDGTDLHHDLTHAMGPGGYSFSIVRPTILEISSLRVNSATALVSTTRPSRITLTTSQNWKISSSLWLM